MKKIILLFTLITVIGCSKDKIFLLTNTDNQKYYLSDSILKIIKTDQISATPIIIIDAKPFEYDTEKDTVFIPIEKKDLHQISFLNQQTAVMLFGPRGDRGAVVIMTKKK